MPSAILIHPAVWPQQTWAKNWWPCPYFLGGAGCPSSTMWPGSRPISIRSGILIHSTVWPQLIWVENWGLCSHFWGGRLGPYLHNMAWAEAYRRTKWHLDPSSRLATIDMGRKLGAVPPPFWEGERSRHLTQCRMGRGLPSTKWHLDPSSHLATTDMDRKLGACAPLGEGEMCPHLTQRAWPGPRPTCISSFILILRIVWPQYTNVTDRQTGQDTQDRQLSDSIGRTVLQTVAQKFKCD